MISSSSLFVAEQASLSTLPDELLLNIGSRVGPIGASRLICVCKHFQAVFGDEKLWQSWLKLTYHGFTSTEKSIEKCIRFEVRRTLNIERKDTLAGAQLKTVSMLVENGVIAPQDQSFLSRSELNDLRSDDKNVFLMYQFFVTEGILSVSDLIDLRKNVDYAAVYKLYVSGVLSRNFLASLSFDHFLSLCNKSLCDLIEKKYLPVEQAISLTDQEKIRLRHPNICRLIVSNHLKIEDARNLLTGELVILSNTCISRLITENILAIEAARKLTDDQYHKLSDEDISYLIERRAVLFSYQQSGPKSVEDLLDKKLLRLIHPDILPSIMKYTLSLVEAINFTDEEFKILTHPRTTYLIRCNLLTIQEAKRLDKKTFARLCNDELFKHILAGDFTPQQVIACPDAWIKNLLGKGEHLSLWQWYRAAAVFWQWYQAAAARKTALEQIRAYRP